MEPEADEGAEGEENPDGEEEPVALETYELRPLDLPLVPSAADLVPMLPSWAMWMETALAMPSLR